VACAGRSNSAQRPSEKANAGERPLAGDRLQQIRVGFEQIAAGASGPVSMIVTGCTTTRLITTMALETLVAVSSSCSPVSLRTSARRPTLQQTQMGRLRRRHRAELTRTDLLRQYLGARLHHHATADSLQTKKRRMYARRATRSRERGTNATTGGFP
jgi:hypothetical protein